MSTLPPPIIESKAPRPAWRRPVVIAVLSVLLVLSVTVWIAGRLLGGVVEKQPRTTITRLSSMIRAGIADGGQTLVSTTADSHLGLWKLQDGTEIARIPVDHTPTCLAVSPDQAFAATGSPSNTLTIVDLAARTVLGRVRHQNTVTDAVFSADGQTVASIDTGGELQFSSVATQKPLRKVSFILQNGFTLIPSPSHTHFLALSPFDKVYLVSFAGGQPIPLGTDPEVPTGISFAFRFLMKPVFSPDGLTIITGDVDAVHFWDGTTGKSLGSLKHDGQPAAAAFSPDGALLAVATPKEIIIWKTADRQQLTRLSTPDVHALAFSPGGAELAAAAPSSLRLWNVSTGQPVRAFNQGKAAAIRIIFLPEAKRLMALGSDQTIRLWYYSAR